MTAVKRTAEWKEVSRIRKTKEMKEAKEKTACAQSSRTAVWMTDLRTNAISAFDLA